LYKLILMGIIEIYNRKIKEYLSILVIISSNCYLLKGNMFNGSYLLAYEDTNPIERFLKDKIFDLRKKLSYSEVL